MEDIVILGMGISLIIYFVLRWKDNERNLAASLQDMPSKENAARILESLDSKTAARVYSKMHHVFYMQGESSPGSILEKMDPEKLKELIKRSKWRRRNSEDGNRCNSWWDLKIKYTVLMDKVKRKASLYRRKLMDLPYNFAHRGNDT